MSPWISVIATLIGGGAMGALIAGYLLHRRNKRQPVVYSKEIIHIFRKNKDFEELEARLLVKDTTLAGAPEQSVDYLSLVRITLTNKGNTDIDEFKFGVSLKGSNKVVDMRMSTPDRSHKMSLSFEGPVDDLLANEPDFTLKPFNRGEVYSVDIYFTYDEQPGEIGVTSGHAAKLIETQVGSVGQPRPVSEIAFALALVVALISTTTTLAFTEREIAEQKKTIHELREINEQCQQSIKQHGMQDSTSQSPQPSK